MLVDKKIYGKIQQIIERYSDLRFRTVATPDVEMFETLEHYRSEPTDVVWSKVEPNTKWGGNLYSAWFRCDYKPSDEYRGKKLYLHMTGNESLIFVNGVSKGVFDHFHKYVMMTMSANPDTSYHIAVEAYSGTFTPGCMPHENNPPLERYCSTYNGLTIAEELEDVSAFVFDLITLAGLADKLDANSLRKNKVMKCLEKVYYTVDSMPAEKKMEVWRPKLAEARKIMAPYLEVKNSPTVPVVSLTGHSHIDTAWQWTLAESWRKCARTFSSVLNLMEQYPEFIFLQPASCHSWKMRELYPELFERIKKAVAEGRWEPNGAMWVEPDCNITSGESLVRQLLIGQLSTRDMFGYTSDTLWEPDTFGYSASMPQILRSFGVKYFCTTKLSWNDTNRFPYDTFIWKGIDGSSVLTHFHHIQSIPEPREIIDRWNHVQHKDVQDSILMTVGWGDGGGGPTQEAIELARRTKDLEGCPKTVYQPLSQYLNNLEESCEDLPEYCGEMYLELHRGTLTSIAGVKRGNRKAELACRNAELASTIAASKGFIDYPMAKFHELWRVLLTNQFHDILPGTSIEPVNREAVEEFNRLYRDFNTITNVSLDALSNEQNNSDALSALLFNSLNWSRDGEIMLDNIPTAYKPADQNIQYQYVTGVDDGSRLIIKGLTVNPMSVKNLPLIINEDKASNNSPFIYNGTSIETPLMKVVFDDKGAIISLFDKNNGREYVTKSGALNKFMVYEDVPQAWDNWDIDRDYMKKGSPDYSIISHEVVSDGPLQFRIRNTYKLAENSTMIQDVVFHSDSMQIDFETKIDWHEKHTLLKTNFDFDVHTNSMKNEIQYGYLERPTHFNTTYDSARFEVSNHKWTDVSDNSFGAAILNDCKYGISANGSSLALSLMKSGTHPDTRGDEGIHYVNYAILPHEGAFSTNTVIKPAYEFNIPVETILVKGANPDESSFIETFGDNIIVESVKWAEDNSGYIIRFYDAAKSSGYMKLKINTPYKHIYEVNMMEENPVELTAENGIVKMFVNAFEIKTIKVVL